MNTAAIIGVVWAGCVAVLGFLIWRTPKISEDQRATGAAARVGLPPAAVDCKPGTDTAALDWLKATYAMPEFDAAAGRLQAAIDDQQEGDQP